MPALPLARAGAHDREPVEGGELVEAAVGAPRHLNPLLARPDSVDADVARLVFRGLTAAAPTGVVPDLAQRWDVSDDGRRYRFFLRPAAWHDGRPVTAEDAIFTVRLVQSAAFPGDPVRAELWRDVALERVEDGSVRFILPRPDVAFPEKASLGLLPAHAYGGVAIGDLESHALNRRPVGSGPFRVESADLTEVALVAHRAGAGPHPLVERVRFRSYPDAATAFGALARGEANAGRVRPEDRAGLAADDRLVLRDAPHHGRTSTILFNTRAAPWTDVALRRALAAGVDRARLVGVVPALGPLPASSWAYQAPPTPGDPGSLLAGAGWQRADGRWRKDGRELVATIIAGDDPAHLRLAQGVAGQWAALGVRADVQAVGWTGLVRDFLVPGTFQLALVELEWPNHDPDVSAFWHSAGALNLARWRGATADDLLDHARIDPDPTTRTALYRRFQEEFAAEAPAIPLGHPVVYYATPRDLRDVTIPPLRTLSDRFATIGRWYGHTKRVIARF